jgi:hypothetical protein
MRRHLNFSTMISTAIIAAVAAMVAIANVRDVRRSRSAYTRPDVIGTRGEGPERLEGLDGDRARGAVFGAGRRA